MKEPVHFHHMHQPSSEMAVSVFSVKRGAEYLDSKSPLDHPESSPIDMLANTAAKKFKSSSEDSISYNNNENHIESGMESAVKSLFSSATLKNGDENRMSKSLNAEERIQEILAKVMAPKDRLLESRFSRQFPPMGIDSDHKINSTNLTSPNVLNFSANKDMDTENSPIKSNHETPIKGDIVNSKLELDIPNKLSLDLPTRLDFTSPTGGKHIPLPKSSQSKKNLTDEMSPKSAESPRGGSFPCVWYDSSSHLRNGDAGERSPQRPENSSTDAQAPPPQSPSKTDEPPKTPVSKVTPSIPFPLTLTPGGVSNTASPRPPSHDGHSSDGEVTGDVTLPSALTGEDASVEVCRECNKVFKRKVYLQRHMEREHWSTAKVFKCEDCNYETKHQSNLSVHRRTHTGERPYHCGCCGQRYTQGHLLKSHIRSRHGGNMEFYNLEKKSDSTRGRKSLDMKHEIPMPPLGVPHKSDKISTLLQAAAAVNGPPRMTPPKPPMFGGLPMGPGGPNMFSPYFNALRPMMNNPLAMSNNLLANPRFFALGGMANGLPTSMVPPSMQHNMPLLSTSKSLPTTTPSNMSSLSPNPLLSAMKMPLKLPEMSIPGLKPPMSPKQSPIPKMSPQQAQDLSQPQDLTTKRSQSPAFEPQDLSKHKEVDYAPPTPPQDSSPTHHQTHLSDNTEFDLKFKPLIEAEQKYEPRNESHTPELESFRVSTPKSESQMYPQAPQAQDAYSFKQPLTPEPVPSPDIPRESTPPLRPEAASTPISDCAADGFCDKNCAHAQQLRKLRKNVIRMLSVFSPDLGSEKCNDCNSDQVDQLLHEVIFSNMDELYKGCNKATALAGGV